MRLLELQSRPYGPLDSATIPLDGLIMILGPNSVGKTSALELIGEFLVDEPPRVDPDSRPEFAAEGVLVFELDEADVPDHPESSLYRELITEINLLRLSEEMIGALLEVDWKAIEGLPADEARPRLVDALVFAAEAGGFDARLIFAQYCLSSHLVRFDGSEICLAVRRPLDAEVRRAVEEIAAASDGSDPLGDVAISLAQADFAPLRLLGWWLTDRGQFFSALIDVVHLDLEIENLNAEISKRLVEIHNRLWALTRLEWMSTDPDQGMPLRLSDLFVPRRWGRFGLQSVVLGTDIDEDFESPAEVCDEFKIDPVTSQDNFSSDTWLERGASGVDDLTGGSPDWFRVKPSLLGAARLISEWATEIAPLFIGMEIRVEILEPSRWHEEPSRVRVVLVDQNEHIDLRMIGSGVARWASAAIRLACARLACADLQVTDPLTGETVASTAVAKEIAVRAREDPYRAPGLTLKRGRRPQLLLIDEPEAHLHPAAISSVAGWLEREAAHGAVVVATHHPQLVNLVSRRAHTMLLSRTVGGPSRLTEITEGIHKAFESVADEMGLRPADLLLLTRLIVFVEGPHDEAVLTGMFGEDLERAGILLIPIFGTDHAQAIVDSIVIGQLGIPLAIFVDNLSPSHVRAGSPASREEIAVTELMAECRRRGITLEPMGHPKRDILEFIDDTVYARHASSSFPGWSEGVKECRGEGKLVGTDIKVWMSKKYDLKLDRKSVYQLAKECAELGLRPRSLEQRIKQMIAYADRSDQDPRIP